MAYSKKARILKARSLKNLIDCHPQRDEENTNKTPRVTRSGRTIILPKKQDLNRVAVLADIEKAFLQIVLSEKDTGAVRFLFVEKIDKPIVQKFSEQLWLRKIQWDAEPPTGLNDEWSQWCKELLELSEIRVPRFILDSFDENI
ncbi:hypothetical protein NPIL_419651 [Nephila pilipes]|uniref:Uncharacterized protein n=1 Tax=Nephila pilipes TaxID=299642 RepID=A0A8X6QG57_NEPPI|nr:hypothetical protein NPIL_419651 [Nephila pilipes]